MSFKRIGYVGKPVGLKGMFLLYDICIDADTIRSLKYIYIGHGDAPDDVMELEETSRQGDRIGLKLAGISSRKEAESRLHAAVFASLSELGDTAEDTEENVPLIGFDVLAKEGPVGVVTEILDSPAHPILVIRRTDGGELLLPQVDEFVRRIDHRRRRIHVRLIEGLTDED